MNKAHSDVTYEMIQAAKAYYRRTRPKFTNGKKLARAIDCSTWQACFILRELNMERWTQAKNTTKKTPYVVPVELRT